MCDSLPPDPPPTPPHTQIECTLRQLLEAGLAATVNSDDPAYFGGYVNDNFVQTFDALGLGAQQAYALAHNSFAASFIGEDEKQRHQHRLAELFEGFR